jgi:hypothetical protein
MNIEMTTVAARRQAAAPIAAADEIDERDGR